MALTARLSLQSDTLQPEDFFASALGTIFTDDVTCQHGDANDSLVYTSPHLPSPLHIDLADPTADEDRKLFSHFLWNSSLLLAELIERDTVGLDDAGGLPGTLGHGVSFDVRGLSVVELGAGTALPSIMAGLLGAPRVVVTDYPAPTVMSTLHINVNRNLRPELSPSALTPSVLVAGHEWGALSDSFASEHARAFDRIFLADCLWMPWQHAALHRSVAFFLGDGPGARCWVVGGFHTGRLKMRGFFEEAPLMEAGLEVESIWERDCNGEERPWSWDRDESIHMRKRWLVVAVLKRTNH